MSYEDATAGPKASTRRPNGSCARRTAAPGPLTPPPHPARL